jgi:hypothetical protein
MNKNIKKSEKKSKFNETTKNPAISVYHVGARENYVPINYPHHFDQDIEFFLFEAGEDKQGSNVILSDGRLTSSSFTNIPKLLWHQSNSVKFFERRCPYTSGIHKFNEKYKDWYFFGNGSCDYLLGQAHKTVRSKLKKAITLDMFVRNHKNKNSPAILCIDAQGASLQILQGANRFLNESVLGVICEVEFEQFYRNAALFGDVHKHLLRKGFHFVRLIPENGWGLPFRSPVGLRSGSLTASADAMFIRIPSYIQKSRNSSIASAYVLLCHMWGIVDLVGPALPFIRRLRYKSPIHEFAADVALHWGEICHTNKCRARDFNSQHRQKFSDEMCSDKRHPRKPNLSYKRKIWSKYEKTLLKYGFTELANNINNIRSEQESFICHDVSSSNKPAASP